MKEEYKKSNPVKYTGLLFRVLRVAIHFERTAFLYQS